MRNINLLTQVSKHGFPLLKKCLRQWRKKNNNEESRLAQSVFLFRFSLVTGCIIPYVCDNKDYWKIPRKGMT